MPHSLPGPNSRKVAVILNLNKDFDRKIAKGISTYAKKSRSWTVYLEDDYVNRIPSFQHLNASGVIANLDDANIVDPLLRIALPMVGVGGAASPAGVSLDIPYVATDNWRIAELGVQHLIDRGLKHFAYCGLPANESDPHTAWSLVRQESFVKSLFARKLTCEVLQIAYTQPNQWETMQRQLTTWLAGLPKPVGVMACDDPKGRHLIVACQNAGITVPDEVAVIGVDNDELMCQMISPELTSVIQNAEQIGYLAAETLDRLMSEIECPAFQMVPPTGLAIRQSSDAIHIDDPIVADCLRLIRDRVDRNLKVADVVKYSGYSREMLDIRFRQAVQRTVFASIHQEQVERTKELLLTTTYSLRAIAERLGFSSEQYLVRWFQQSTGELPGAFRTARRK